MRDVTKLRELIENAETDELIEYAAAWSGTRVEDYKALDLADRGASAMKYLNNRYLRPSGTVDDDESAVLKLEDSDRSAPTGPPANDPCGNSACRTFEAADVLFRSSDGSWYALSEEAKSAFDEQEQKLDEAIEPLVRTYSSSDPDEREQARRESLQQLHDLRVLDRFMGFRITRFLEEQDQKKHADYKLRIQASRTLLEEIELGNYPDDLSEQLATDAKLNERRGWLREAEGQTDRLAEDRIEHIRNQVERHRNAIIDQYTRACQRDIRQFQDRLDTLEAEAKQSAREQGYIWKEGQGNYFETSFVERMQCARNVLREEATARQCLRHAIRPPSGVAPTLENLANHYPQYQAGEAHVWPDGAQSPGVWDKAMQSLIPKLERLNRDGWVILEQCLEPREVVGGPGADSTETIAQLQWEDLEDMAQVLESNATMQRDAEWGLEQYDALIEVARQRLTERLSVWDQLLGAEAPEEFVEPGLKVLRYAFDKANALRTQARNNVRDGRLNNERLMSTRWSGEFELLSAMGDIEETMSEYAYLPPEGGNVTLVECMRASTGNRLRYVTSNLFDGWVADPEHARALDVDLANKFRTMEGVNEGSGEVDARGSGSVKDVAVEAVREGLDRMSARLDESLKQELEWVSDAAASFHAEAVEADDQGRILATGSQQAEFFRFAMGGSLESELLQRSTSGSMTGAYGSGSGEISVHLAEARSQGNLYYPHAEGSALVLEYIAEHEDGDITRHAYFGQFRLELMVEAGGYAGATAGFCMSPGIYSGNQGVALKPSESVTLPGAEAGVDLFAGVEAVGCMAASLRWKAPDSDNTRESAELIDYINVQELREAELARRAPATQLDLNEDWALVFDMQGAVRVAMGSGLKASFILTLNNGKLVFKVDWRFVKGVGIGGSLGGAVDLDTCRQLVDAILGLLNSEGFRRLSVFDEDENGNSSYQFLNHAMTLALSSGANFANLLLMPYDWLANAAEARMRREAAPDIAEAIIDMMEKQEEETKRWLRSCLPETKGRLVYVLLTEQRANRRIVRGTSVWNQDSGDFDDENDQRRALLYLLEYWSEKESGHDRQIEESLTRMHPEGDKPFQHGERYLNHLMPMAVRERIRAFFERGTEIGESMSFEQSRSASYLKNEAEKAIRTMEDFFNQYERQGSDNAVWYRRPSSSALPGEDQQAAWERVKDYVRTLH